MKNLVLRSSTIDLLAGIYSHISRRRRIQLLLLLIVMLASAVAELLSLGAVLPFLTALSDIDRLWDKPQFQMISVLLGFTDSSQLVLLFTVLFVSSAIVSALIRMFNVWLNGRLAAAIGSDLSCEAYRRTLYQPYETHLKRNSAEIITTTTNQISITVSAFNSFLQLLTSSFISFALLLGLFLINFWIALFGATLFGFSYYLLTITTRGELRTNSHIISEATTQQLKSLQEGLAAIRDVLLDGNQEHYISVYRKSDRRHRLFQAKNAFLTIFPRYSFEALGMVAIASLGGILVSHKESSVTVIPLLGSLALGAQRLLPALQQVYNGWASLKGGNAAIEGVLKILNQDLPQSTNCVEASPFTRRISFKGVYFRYADDEGDVLKALDLEVRKGESIGLIGSTGSGKSTTLDILMGLLKPNRGNILIDGMNLYDQNFPERLLSWRANIAHVPQSIYLADASIAENIAFGLSNHDIDYDRVRKVASQAQISSFIESIPGGYESFVGERGIRLSGGQRQRIGIARALYKKASVLIFDEATSALDSDTEFEVMRSIDNLDKELTIFMIAHRLSTVQSCDRVIVLSDGRIVDDGTPQQVISKYT